MPRNSQNMLNVYLLLFFISHFPFFLFPGVVRVSLLVVPRVSLAGGFPNVPADGSPSVPWGVIFGFWGGLGPSGAQEGSPDGFGGPFEGGREGSEAERN